jgi:hypothetical protein
MHREEIPLDRDPVILLNEFKAPAMVFFKSDEAPPIIPNPPSSGPLTKPSAGFIIRSATPVEIFLKSPTGFPIIFNDPNTLRTSVIA